MMIHKQQNKTCTYIKFFWATVLWPSVVLSDISAAIMAVIFSEVSGPSADEVSSSLLG